MTKAKKKRTVVRIMAIVLAVLMPLLTTVVAFAEPESGSGITLFGQKKYESPDINALTGHGEEPEEISVSAGATYQEKAWYEYVMYSDHAVSSYRLNDTSRLLFYDPYTYTNSMVMDVQFDATTTEFDTMSSYSISHTKSQSISTCVTSTTTSSNAVQTSGRDRTGTDVTNGGYTKTTYNHSTVSGTTGTVTSTNDYEYKLKVSASETASLSETITASATAGTEAAEKIVGVVPAETTVKVSASATAGSSTSVGGSVTVNEGWVTDKTTNKTTYSDDYKTTTKYTGYDTVKSRFIFFGNRAMQLLQTTATASSSICAFASSKTYLLQKRPCSLKSSKTLRWILTCKKSSSKRKAQRFRLIHRHWPAIKASCA